MQEINWKDPLPYDHAGRWQKNLPSIMNPKDKVTWPQLVAEFVVYNRKKYWTMYKDVSYGPDWHKAISKHVRGIVQQAYVLCNYFPHPQDEPMVEVAFKNVFRNFRFTKIGQFRKVRTKKNGNQNITQDEKDVVQAIHTELCRLIEQRNIFKDVINAANLAKEKLAAKETAALEDKIEKTEIKISKPLRKKKLSLDKIANLENESQSNNDI